MGFREKNAWICGLSILIVFTPYFCWVFPNPMSHVGLFAMAVFCLVALLVGFHVVNAILTPSIRKTGDVPEADELDRLIELKASKFAGIVLAVAVLGWSISAMVGIPAQGVFNVVESQNDNSLNASDFGLSVNQGMRWVHLLFAGFVVSNLLYYARIVLGYRRLSHG